MGSLSACSRLPPSRALHPAGQASTDRQIHDPSRQRTAPPQAGGVAAMILTDMTAQRPSGQLTYAARLLSAPIRLNMLTSLLRKETSVSDLSARLGADRHHLSYHLAILSRHALLQPAKH